MKLTTYTPEFRAEAVKLVLAQGLTLEEAAKRIAIPKGTLANWVSAAKRGSDPKAPPGSGSVAELEAEVAKLRKELTVERMEKEVLKKATAYFARESLPGTSSANAGHHSLRREYLGVLQRLCTTRRC